MGCLDLGLGGRAGDGHDGSKEKVKHLAVSSRDTCCLLGWISRYPSGAVAEMWECGLERVLSGVDLLAVGI